MSNFSDFFPAGGSTASGATSQIINGTTYGNIIAKPTDPLYVISQCSYTEIQLAGYNSNASDFQSANNLDPMNYFVSVTGINTYFTIADITGASNGGFLYNIISPYPQAAATTSIRITLDGTAYTFSANLPAYRRLLAGPLGTNTSNVGQGWYNMNPSGPSGDEFNAGQVAKYQYVRFMTGSVASELNLPKIFFNSSCKVEVQASAIQSQAPGRAAFCSIETL
jgi:hypothetical protein